MSPDEISLLLIDMHILFIEGLVSLLEAHSQFKIVGAYTNPVEGLQGYKKLLPDISIISDCMSSLNTITLVQEIKLHNKDAKILVLAAKLSEFTVIETIRAGVMGFISRTNDFLVLQKALHEIHNNQPYYCNKVSQILASNLMNEDNTFSIRAVFKKLTSREKEIMLALLDGMSINDIGKTLYISRKTVTTHKSNIYKKFKISNVIEFVRIGVELGV